MTPISEDRRRRTIESMGLGPLWVRRSGAGVGAPAEGASGRIVRIASLGLDDLQDDVAACVACGLSQTRTRTVFGVGVARPDWLVIGEAPGADEDARGEPFVGAAGRLLDAMLAAIGLSRERNVFIANVLKCRPPGNRDPSAAEVASCRPYLERQIELLAPRLILVVGKVASAALLGGDVTMSRLRGKQHALTIGGRSVPLVATYHPAYLLRSPEEKAKAWADLCFARDLFERIASSEVD